MQESSAQPTGQPSKTSPRKRLTETAKISVVFIGQFHEDPLPIAALNDVINSPPFNTTVPIAICRELPEDASLENNLSSIQNIVRKNKQLLAMPIIGQYLDLSLSRGIFPQQIRHKLLTQFMVLGYQPEHFCFLEKQAAYIEEERLYTSVASKSIKFMGIDLNSQQRSLLENQTDTNPNQTNVDELAIKFEPIRITSMVKNLLTRIQGMSESGGVIFVSNLGSVHAHRLAASLRQELLKQSQPNKVALFAMICKSPYLTSELQKEMDIKEKLFKQHDSAEIQKIYTDIPCYSINFEEEKHSHKAVSPLFTEVVEKAVAHVTTHKIFIPNFNPEKAEIINNLGGVLLEETPEGRYVSVRVDKLIKPIREKLGIEKFLITSNDSQTQLQQLLIKPTISVQLIQANKYMVTFPNQELTFVHAIVDDKKQQEPQARLNN